MLGLVLAGVTILGLVLAGVTILGLWLPLEELHAAVPLLVCVI